MGFNLQLPHLAQGLNGVDIYKQGLELGDLWLERKKNAELAKIERDTQDIEDSGTRFEKMIGLAKQSKRSKWLIDDINAMQSAQAQAQLANQAKMADINKTMSETNKNNATATDTMAGVAKKRMDMTNPLYEVLAGSGNLEMGRSFLKNRHTMGAIDDEQYQALLGELATLEGLTGDELKNWAWHIRKGDLPVDVLHQTANNRADNERALATNRLDNETSRYNNALDNETSRYNNELDNQTARQNNIDDNQLKMWQAEQEQALKAGEIDQVMVGTDGNSYLIYKDGRVEMAMQGVALGNGKNAQAGNKHAKDIADLQGANDSIDTALSSLNKALELSEQGIYDGYFASQRADLMGNFGGTDESKRTQMYQNIITNQALSSLKSVFGGSPTEGEREMLLKVQASASYPADVRRAILQEAMQMAQQKQTSNRRQMQILGGGGTSTPSPSGADFGGGSNPFFD